jgi:tripartite-type tricarboxylate transporter receptor subunit TctC
VRACVAIVFTLLASAAAAQSWPTRPVTLLAPFPPGGGTDVTARTFALKLAERLGQNGSGLIRARGITGE